MLGRRQPSKPPPKAAKPPRSREAPVETADALRALGEGLTGRIAQYHDIRTAIVEREARLLWGILDAIGAPVAEFLAALPERSVSPIRQPDSTYVSLIDRVHDHIVLWSDGTLALVPFEGAPVHYASPKEFVEQVGIGFARPIAQAIGREVKRANARLPTLVADLSTYAGTLPPTDPIHEGTDPDAEE